MPLQPETDSTHVPNFQLHLSSQIAEFELQLELLKNGVERPADILEAVHDSAVDVVEVQHLLR